MTAYRDEQLVHLPDDASADLACATECEHTPVTVTRVAERLMDLGWKLVTANSAPVGPIPPAVPSCHRHLTPFEPESQAEGNIGGSGGASMRPPRLAHESLPAVTRPAARLADTAFRGGARA